MGEGDYYSIENDSDTCNMSYKNRVIGFLTCVGVGTVLNLFSYIALVSMFTGKPYRFALLFTLGNIVSITGLIILLGLKKQIKTMFASKRWITTSVYLLAMIMTLISACAIGNAFLTII